MDDKVLMSQLAEEADKQSERYTDSDFTDSPLSAEEDPYKACTTEEEVRIKILLSAIKSANRVYIINTEHERKKAFWRGYFIIFMSIILVASLVAIGILLFLGRLETSALIACLSYVVANIIAIMFFMIKYVHNDLYLETFKTVTQKLLDYLVEDKNGKFETK